MTPKDKTRQTKLNELQEKHGTLTARRKSLKNNLNEINSKLTEVNKELSRLGAQIFDLKNIDGDTPHITDHAVVRYLERVEKMDIWDIKARIVAHRDSVRVDNTIVTVNGDEDNNLEHVCKCKVRKYIWHEMSCPVSPEERVQYP